MRCECHGINIFLISNLLYLQMFLVIYYKSYQKSFYICKNQYLKL